MALARVLIDVRWPLLLILLLPAVACQANDEANNAPPDDCGGEPAYAMEPATGDCWEFANHCAVFPDWPPCEPCTSNDDCGAPDHCRLQSPDLASPTPGVCTNACTIDMDCLSTQHCDPATSRCEPGAPGSPPPEDDCSGNSSCVDGEVCPAQFGGCSPTDPSTGILCPSTCEAACTDDTTCAAADRCNAADVCATPAYDEADSPPPGCFGWCVPR